MSFEIIAIHLNVARHEIPKIVLAALFSSLILAMPAAATPITGSPVTGLVNPDIFIDFEEGGIITVPIPEPVITNEFTGVTFGEGFGIQNFGTNVVENMTGRILFSDNQNFPAVYTMVFDENVLAAGFNLRTNTGTTTTFTALLSGVFVEDFMFDTDVVGSDNFFGFRDTLFDEIQFSINGQVGFIFDNLQLDLETSVVPLPAALPLYGTGLAIMGFIGWRRKRKATA